MAQFGHFLDGLLEGLEPQVHAHLGGQFAQDATVGELLGDDRLPKGPQAAFPVDEGATLLGRRRDGEDDVGGVSEDGDGEDRVGKLGRRGMADLELDDKDVSQRLGGANGQVSEFDAGQDERAKLTFLGRCKHLLGTATGGLWQ